MMIKSPKKFCLEDCFRASAPPLGLPSGNLELGRSRRTGTNIDIRSKSFEIFNLAIDDDVNDEDLDDEKQDPCGENSAGGENDQLPELEKLRFFFVLDHTHY